MECVTSLVTKVTSDEVTMMTLWWNTSGLLKMSKTGPQRLISYHRFDVPKSIPKDYLNYDGKEID